MLYIQTWNDKLYLLIYSIKFDKQKKYQDGNNSNYNWLRIVFYVQKIKNM